MRPKRKKEKENMICIYLLSLITDKLSVCIFYVKSYNINCMKLNLKIFSYSHFKLLNINQNEKPNGVITFIFVLQ